MDIELEKKFINACISKAEADKTGDSKTGNKYYKVINDVYLTLKESGKLTEILVLLNHENPNVRLWASTYALQIPKSDAVNVLETISHMNGLLGFDAGMVLSEWRKGNLKF